MKRSRTLVLIAALVLLPAPLFLGWNTYGKTWLYQVTFGPRAAEQLLAEISLPNIKVINILKHEGGPKVWMDAYEYVSASVETIQNISVTTTLPPPDRRNVLRARGLWVATDNPDAIVQKAIDAMNKCRNNLEKHGELMGDEGLERPTAPGILYSISAASLDDMSIIHGVIYDPAGKTITIVHCDY